MLMTTLPRHRAGGSWSHPYGHGPFSPYLYADGGEGDGSESGGNGGEGAGTGGQEGAGAGGGEGSGGAGGDAGAGKGGKEGGADDSAAKIARLEKDLDYARKEAGKARTAAKQAAADEAVKEVTARLGKALGFGSEDKPPTPEELTKALEDRDAKISARNLDLRAKDVQLAVYGRAEAHNAKASALLDSVSFRAAIKDLDPAADGFGAALDDAIKKAVKANPSFSVTTAGRSGGDLGSGAGEGGAKKRSASLAGAITDHYRT
ncbi:hypothetical protein [Streptomyces chryseus]